MTMSTREQQHATLADPRWPLLAARSPEAEGVFVYAVVTTGVYCRPTCPSRLAHPENIRFYDTAGEAASAGFRPCRRCRPDGMGRTEERAAIVERLCRIIETTERQPTLAQLAERAGWSPHHLHRTFKAVTGLTPRAYGAARRAGQVRQALVHGRSVTDALYAAGYSSSGRFYAESDGILGMTPGRYRTGGRDVEIRFAVGDCSLGAILVARSERGICTITLGDDPDALVRDLQDRFPEAKLVGGDAAFEQEVARVVGLVDAPGVGLDLPLDIRGTAFQRRVWAALQEIPPGETRSYRQVAERIGSPHSARAVAGACAANPLAVAIPCHRVVRTDGGLSGYRWGVERKRALLDREVGE